MAIAKVQIGRQTINNLCIYICFMLTVVLTGCFGIRCYSDHSGPNSAGGIERCDADSVCSLARIIYREDGLLRKATARQCVSRTPDRSGTEWPWCTEEWAGGDEGGMEVLTCYCNQELCNDNNLLRGKLSEWTATTMARLKAGPTHVLDILISIATGCVIVFFIAVVMINIQWRKIFGMKQDNVEVMEESENIGSDGETENKREKED